MFEHSSSLYGTHHGTGLSSGKALPAEGYLGVSELTQQIKSLLEGSFSLLKVEGEISNFRPSRAGHLYFTLKDNQSVISCVLFRGNAAGLSFMPRDGMVVRVTGELSLYAPRGNYQIICRTMIQGGAGDILALLEERKKKLAALGLFDPARKKSIPAFPRRVAVITSPTGAALRDILQVLHRRHRGVHLTVLPATVQGERAPQELINQIRRANTYGLGEVILLARGGGSLEDLLPFSDEGVVKAVAASRIPVITGIGHGTDTALADLAADRRTPTPSAAAEMVAESREALSRSIAHLGEQILFLGRSRVERARLLIDRFSSQELSHRLQIFLLPHHQRIDETREELLRSMKDSWNRREHRLHILQETLEGHSPYGILRKGYVMMEDPVEGSPLKGISDLKKDQEIVLRSWDGTARTVIKETNHE